MKTKSRTFSILISFAAFAVLAFAGVAHAQTVRSAGVSAGQHDTAGVAAVNTRSPAVNLKAVGRRVAPGILEVDPEAIRGKRIAVLTGGGGTVFKGICIGKWKDGGCSGVYIDLNKNNSSN